MYTHSIYWYPISINLVILKPMTYFIVGGNNNLRDKNINTTMINVTSIL